MANEAIKETKKEAKLQKKLAKQRAKDLAKESEDLEETSSSNPVSTILVTLVIVIIWLFILALLIKLDVGGFASSVLTPALQDVPVIQNILPSSDITETNDATAYSGYTSLQSAVDEIARLESELAAAEADVSSAASDIATLKAEVERLETFEDSQVEFQRIKTQFYDEVIYADNGPGVEAYVEYYESIDPTTAEYLYKQVVQQLEETEEITDYAKAYSEMSPKEAAAIFEEMTNDLALVARILGVMSATDRGAILGVMDSEIASLVTKIMDPES
ncbi:MAG: hypothetical protein R3Y67_05350 [Eubacteriales bacterium]